jgi:undecaprenyl-diphosphatase
MNIFESTLLGIIQGLTEFLPVSSSGHLALVENIFGYRPEYFTFDILLHVATLCAILVYFRQDLVKLFLSLSSANKFRDEYYPRLFVLLGIATFLTAVIGVALKKFIAGAFEAPGLLALFFAVTGVLLLFADRKKESLFTLQETPLWHAVVIGLFQSAALFPGLSRAGFTIAGALLLGWARPQAFRFSFLLAIPAIAGAGLIEARKISSFPSEILVPALIGCTAAFFTAFAALMLLEKMMKHRRLYLFSIYLFVLSTVIFAFLI